MADRSCPFASSFVFRATILALGLALPAEVVRAVDADDAPGQHGNSFSSGTFSYIGNSPPEGQALYPIFGRVNVADNNSPIPTDRVYFFYNHYQNSLDASTGFLGSPPFDRAAMSVDQYTFGAEKTLLDGLCSVELRMPFFTQTSAFVGGGSNTLDVFGGCVGNLTVINKLLLYNAPTFALTAGLGVSLPTGDDARFDFPLGVATLKNQAVHLQPFLGFASTPNARSFFQGFIQVDTPLNGNGIELNSSSPVALTNDRLTDQSVMFLDISAGYWLYRDRESSYLTGLAPMVELHYTTSLEDAANAENKIPFTGSFAFGNPRNRFDMLNLTIGLHTEFRGQTQIRVGGVFPLSSGDNNFFDSEIQFSIIRRF